MTDQSRAEAVASDDMGYAGWVLLGGGLLIVAGGAAFALSRRPKRRAEADVAYEVPVVPVTPAAVALSPVVKADAVQPRREAFAHAAVEEPRRPVAPSQVHGSGDHGYDDRQAILEAMVAEAPSDANPFHARRNRLRRADFLLRTGQAQQGKDFPVAPRPEKTAMGSDRWSEMRFGGKQNARVSWKPVTTR